MRVFYFGIYSSYGGLENFAHNLVISLHKKGIDFTLITPAKKIAFEDDFKRLGCSIAQIPDFKRHPFAYYQSFCRILKQAKVGDVVQLNICSYRNILPFLACKRVHINTIVVGHYTSISDGKWPWLHWLNKRLVRSIGVKVTNSQDVTTFMFCKKSNPVVILNGIDTNRFTFSAASRDLIRKQYAIHSGIAVGQIGRISSDKNQIFSITVFEQLHSIDQSFYLYLLGTETDKSVREYVNGHGLNKYIIFEGERSSGIEKWYSALDLLLLPSPKEGLSLSMLEAACNGVQMIASSAVPKLSVVTDNIAYLDLDPSIWCTEILKHKKSVLTRTDSIKGTDYDLEISALKFLYLYQHFPDYKGNI